MILRATDIYRHLPLDRLSKETFGRIKHALKKRVIDAVTANIQKPDLARSAAELIRDALLFLQVPAREGRYVDDRDAREVLGHANITFLL
jgi:hypothetical protein